MLSNAQLRNYIKTVAINHSVNQQDYMNKQSDILFNNIKSIEIEINMLEIKKNL